MKVRYYCGTLPMVLAKLKKSDAGAWFETREVVSKRLRGTSATVAGTDEDAATLTFPTDFGKSHKLTSCGECRTPFGKGTYVSSIGREYCTNCG